MSSRQAFRVDWLLAAALICCGLADASPALAQLNSDQAPSNIAWTARIGKLLSLDARQEAAFGAYLATLQNPATQGSALSAEQFRSMNMPQRLDFISDRIALDLSAARAQAQAIHRFYALLSVDQRRLFDAATMPVERSQFGAQSPASQPPPASPDYRLPGHTEADWLTRPTADDVTRVYPTLAARNNISGKVLLDCTADEDGYLADCIVDSEFPAGQGFGNAALEITAYMRMKPATNFGVPVRSTVTVPVTFQLAD
jgi:TonB family protein